MKIKEIDINLLKPANYNPRQITKKQFKDLKTSIQKFGLIDPIIVNKDLTVIGGHQRLMVCKDLDFKDVPCVVLNLTKEKKNDNLSISIKEKEKELNVRLNKSGGEFDMDILANEFEISDLNDWGFSDLELGLKSFDFKEEEVEDLSDTFDDSVKIELKMPIETYKEIDKQFNSIITKYSEIKCKVIN